jgi:HEAT repeat protein
MTKTIIAIVVACVLNAQPVTNPNVDRARGILLAGFEDKDPDVRVQAVKALGMVGRNEQMTKSLVDHLDDKDVKVRIAAISTIVDLKDNFAIVPLQKRLIVDDVPEVAFSAAKALYVLKDPQGKIALEAMFSKDMKSGSGFIRTTVRDLVRTVKTPRSAMLFALRNGVGYIPVPGLGEGVGAAIDLLTDGDLSARANVVLIIVTDKSEENRAMIATSLTDSDWTVRAAGLQALAMLNWVEFLPQVESLLDDKKDKVRFRAAATYLRLTTIAGKQN